MKYLSLDIETTGLSIEKSLILEIAAVMIVDQKDPLIFHNIIKYPVIEYGEPGALAMNGRLFAAMGSKTLTLPNLEQARENFRSFLAAAIEYSGDKRLTVAGKNVASFDIPILRNQGFSTTLFSHRCVDVGSLYLTDFGKVPSLSEINTLTGGSKVTHEALKDAFDVVRAIEFKLNPKPVEVPAPDTEVKKDVA